MSRGWDGIVLGSQAAQLLRFSNPVVSLGHPFTQRVLQTLFHLGELNLAGQVLKFPGISHQVVELEFRWIQPGRVDLLNALGGIPKLLCARTTAVGRPSLPEVALNPGVRAIPDRRPNQLVAPR